MQQNALDTSDCCADEGAADLSWQASNMQQHSSSSARTTFVGSTSAQHVDCFCCETTDLVELDSHADSFAPIQVLCFAATATATAAALWHMHNWIVMHRA